MSSTFGGSPRQNNNVVHLRRITPTLKNNLRNL
jgi:hypothetical protein